jgi:aspartate carbamoyltransferase catalytic subunit
VVLVEPVIQADYSQARQESVKEKPLTPANFKITRELLMSKAKSDMVLLHSLPRMDEIPPDVDITRWSRYWQEAFYGVVLKMGLLSLVLGAAE